MEAEIPSIGPGVAPELSAEQADFIRRALLSERETLRADMAEFPEQFPHPAKTLQAIKARTGLILSLERGAIMPDREVRVVLGELSRFNSAEEGSQPALFKPSHVLRLLVECEERFA